MADTQLALPQRYAPLLNDLNKRSLPCVRELEAELKGATRPEGFNSL